MNVNVFTTIRKKKAAANGASRSFRIGERVQNPNHGRGVVRAIHPHGTLIVRFEGQKKSRSIFPSFLEKTI